MSKPYVISIIDDDEIYKYTVTKTIEIKKLAEKVFTFSDGDEAIKFLKKNHKHLEVIPDLIFLDINMPIMDGFQFMEEYVKISPLIKKKIKVYMITSSVDPVDLEHAKKYKEISAFIVKPIKPKDLEDIINGVEKKP